jgi:hypothetical protein
VNSKQRMNSNRSRTPRKQHTLKATMRPLPHLFACRQRLFLWHLQSSLLRPPSSRTQVGIRIALLSAPIRARARAYAPKNHQQQNLTNHSAPPFQIIRLRKQVNLPQKEDGRSKQKKKVVYRSRCDETAGGGNDRQRNPSDEFMSGTADVLQSR